MTTEARGERERGRGRRREGRGIVSVLIGTALLGMLGFGLGIAAGLVLEEPSLLLDYVTGRTQSAPLDEARAERDVAALPPEPAPEPSPSAAAPPVDSAPPAAAKTAAQDATPAVAAAPPIEPPAPAKSAPKQMELPLESVAATLPSQGGFSVQVGALADAASAEALAGKLRKRGLPVYVAPSAEPGSRRWRVRVGPVATREQAQQLADKLGKEKLPTWVLAEGPR